jgi:hypothetical protein
MFMDFKSGGAPPQVRYFLMLLQVLLLVWPGQ